MRTLVCSLWLAGMVFGACAQDAPAPAALTTERAQLEHQRVELAQQLKQQEAACYQKFAVEDCLRDARRQARAQDQRLRDQLWQIEAQERADKAQQRRQTIEEQQRAQQERLQVAPPPPQLRSNKAPRPATTDGAGREDALQQRAAEKAQRRQELDERAAAARQRQEETQRRAQEKQHRHAQQQAQDAAAGRSPSAPLPAVPAQ